METDPEVEYLYCLRFTKSPPAISHFKRPQPPSDPSPKIQTQIHDLLTPNQQSGACKENSHVKTPPARKPVPPTHRHAHQPLPTSQLASPPNLSKGAAPSFRDLASPNRSQPHHASRLNGIQSFNLYDTTPIVLGSNAPSSTQRKRSELQPVAPDADTSYLSKLNNKQKEAVEADAIPLVIIASAGSGKTTTLIARIMHLLNRGATGFGILAITFTRKAAEEMRDRVEKSIGWTKAAGITVCNFHQLALRILRDHYKLLGFKQHFTVFGAEEQKDAVRVCVEEWVELQRRQSGKADLSKVSRRATDFLKQNDLAEGDELINAKLGAEARSFRMTTTQSKYPEVTRQIINYYTSFIRKMKSSKRPASEFSGDHRFVFQRYEALLKERAGLDFSDMIPLTLHLFQRHPDVLQSYQDRFEHIFCDEYQDVSREQFDLLAMLAGTSNQSITICGDDDQSIYGWRGSCVESFDLFRNTYPNCRTVLLEETYRSTAMIVNTVSELISFNQYRTKKRLWTKNPEGERIRLIICNDRKTEAARVASEIKQRKEKYGLRWGSFAVLARTRRVLKSFELTFKEAGIPIWSSAVKVKTGARCKEVDYLLSYAALVTDDCDNHIAKIYNTPKRGFGKSSFDKVCAHAKQRGIKIMTAMREVANGYSQVLSGRAKQSVQSFLVIVDKIRAQCRHQSATNAMHAVVKLSGIDSYLDQVCTKRKELQRRKAQIAELVSKARGFDLMHSKSNAEFLVTEFVLESLSEKSEADAEAKDFVTVSTIHQAKGLEWPVVFAVHFNEGVLPLPVRDPEADTKHTAADPIEEERRLAYVALSRAKTALYVTFVLRDLMGNPCMPSRFLNELPSSLMHDEGDGPLDSDSRGVATIRNTAQEEPGIQVGPARQPTQTNNFQTASSLIAKQPATKSDAKQTPPPAQSANTDRKRSFQQTQNQTSPTQKLAPSTPNPRKVARRGPGLRRPSLMSPPSKKSPT